MAQETYFKGNNFNGGAEPTTYLNYAGLTALWSKVKEYVDNNDSAVAAAAKAKIDANDAAVRSYIESLDINGVTVTSDKAEGKLGTSLEVVLKGSDITVGEGAGKYSGKDGEGDDAPAYTVSSSLGDIDSRLNVIDGTLAEGVVSGLIVDVNHGDYTTTTTDEETGESVTKTEKKAWVEVSEIGTPSIPGTPGTFEVGDITITVDDTALNDKIKSIDEEISELIANAGVTNIAVKDVDNSAEGAVNKGLVEITLSGSKDAVSPGAGFVGDVTKRGDILITLNETALDEKLDTIDGLIADRKADSLLLAGDNAEIGADGKLVWKKNAEDKVIQAYQNLTSVSARLEEMDANLVTKVEESKSSVENYVKLDVESAAAAGSNDNSVVIKIDDSDLKDYITSNEANLMALNGLKINEQPLITVTNTGGVLANGETKQVEVKSTSVTLNSSHISRSSDASETIEDALDRHDTAIEALASATHFRGVIVGISKDNQDLDLSKDLKDGVEVDLVKIKKGTGDESLQPIDGDIFITSAAAGSKEFIFYSGALYELGDTTAENDRISALETWVDTNIINQADINALFDGTVNADLKAETNKFDF